MPIKWPSFSGVKGKSVGGTNKLKRAEEGGSSLRGGIGGWFGGYVLGQWDTKGGFLRGIVDRYVPTFANQVAVKVQCAPRAWISDAYYLALSCAFGATEELTYSSSNKITVVIDRAEKSVSVVLDYESNGLNTGVNQALSSFITSGKDVIAAGVPDTINGGDWPGWLKRDILGNPDLPLVGKPIATHKITSLGNDKFGANYVPRLDGLSRDNDLTTIIAAALLEGPCSSPAAPALTTKPPAPPQSLVSVPTLGSYAPENGGVDTNRWAILASQGVTGAMPTWNPPNNYKAS